MNAIRTPAAMLTLPSSSSIAFHSYGVLPPPTAENTTSYCHLNAAVPILRLYLDEAADHRAHLRLSLPSIRSLIGALRLESDHGWERDLEVLVFLYWLAHASSYRVVSQTFDIPKTSVHDRAVGAIDGCHIRMKPPANNSHCCYNRKLFHSIQLQAITDHRGKFLDIFVGYPGSVHDARVLRNSPVYVGSLYPPPGKCILGDGGYPCLSAPICLIIPYREPVQNPVQARFNSKHSRARNIIEKAFGMMKTRWRSIFFKALEISPAFVPEVVACCAVLHNLALLNGDIVEAEDEEDHDDDPPEPHNPQARVGDHVRDNLAAAVSAPNICVAALHEHDYL
ncbi:hypothetical protein H4Q32_024214 [Labeo rohita]|uniref:DDE Tnp4 domain-containing protein n=1 Tax=Labeo rohita TaxID=84645 RepID=A0ABQ8LCC5_LABRO|nr:hypothetical protein H4Q32_024214 [Labeo rohita]